MYKNYDNANHPVQSIHAGKHSSDKDHSHVGKEQDKAEEQSADLQDKSEGSTPIVVPFNTTQTGSFQ